MKLNEMEITESEEIYLVSKLLEFRRVRKETVCSTWPFDKPKHRGISCEYMETLSES